MTAGTRPDRNAAPEPKKVHQMSYWLTPPYAIPAALVLIALLSWAFRAHG